MNTPIRLVCFDLNGTLIKENSWENLNLAMGVTPEEDQRLLNLYRNGKISYQEGLDMLLPLYTRGGKFTKDNVLRALFLYSYRDGAKDIIRYLKRKYHIAILSGSFDMLVDKVANELDIPLHAANNRCVFDAGGTGRAIECAGNDNEFKREKILEFCSLLRITPRQCACVGDSENDEEIFRVTGRGITFQNSPVEKTAWEIISKLTDLKKIL